MGFMGHMDRHFSFLATKKCVHYGANCDPIVSEKEVSTDSSDITFVGTMYVVHMGPKWMHTIFRLLAMSHKCLCCL